MKIKFGGKERDASPDLALKAAYEARLAQYKNNEQEARAIVLGIGDLVLNAPQLEASVADYRTSGVGHSRLACKPMRVARFNDGFIMAGMESRADDRIVHRLRFQTGSLYEDQLVNYLQTVSAKQYMEQPNIVDVNSFAAMGESEPAMQGLRLLHDLAVQHHAAGWPHAYDLDSLRIYRMPIPAHA